jgi:hypothetical protein
MLEKLKIVIINDCANDEVWFKKNISIRNHVEKIHLNGMG